jgi:hypothetical protein
MMKCEVIRVEDKTITDEEIAGLEDGEESESSDALWEEFKKHKHEAISLEEYCRQRKIDL